MPTVVTGSSPYLSAAELLTYVDWRLGGDWCADADQRPTRSALLDATSDPGKVLAQFLKWASGDLESACLARSLYSVEDLQALTGNTQAHLKGVVAGLTLWGLARRRNPSSARLDDVPGARAAVEALEALRVGERIFGLADQRAAGAGMESTPLTDTTDVNRTVNRASRFFGNRMGC